MFSPAKILVCRELLLIELLLMDKIAFCVSFFGLKSPQACHDAEDTIHFAMGLAHSQDRGHWQQGDDHRACFAFFL